MRRILGISAFYHDSAAAIVIDGEIVSAAQEERFTRIKHDPSFPAKAVDYCLSQAGLTLPDIDAVVFYDKPLLKFERLLETFMSHAPRGFGGFLKAMPIWLKEKLYLKQLLRRELLALCPSGTTKSQLPVLRFTEHHQSHAASAYFPSPYDDAAVVCMDGVGEWATTSIWHGHGTALHCLEELHFPHSLGLLYSAFTYYCGFKVNSGEYKLMGLAPYGSPTFVDTIYRHLIDVKPDGSFALNLDYFDFPTGHVMTNDKFHRLFGSDPYVFDGTPDQRCMDLARSIQVVTEDIVIKIAKHAKSLTGASHLCLAGGVALNCVANGRLAEEQIFEDVWIQPAAGDAGGALGAALMAWYATNPDAVKPKLDSMRGAYLGPAFRREEIAAAAESWQCPFSEYEQNELLSTVARWLDEDCVVGWFQGRMEFGPRALGNRSILGDARSPTMQSVMNLKIKQRESFRPFAPIVTEKSACNYFSLSQASPYMLFVAQVRESLVTPIIASVGGLEQVHEIRSSLPAITHVDNTARVQTLSFDTNPKLHNLLEVFEARTGIPLLINTSFNVRGEPPVCTPDDAIRCFLATDMDVLVIENCVFVKSQQPESAIEKARSVTFEKD